MKDPGYRAWHLPKEQRLSQKLESLSEQNADPALWQIADPYIGLLQFLPFGRVKSFSVLSTQRHID